MTSQFYSNNPEPRTQFRHGRVPATSVESSGMYEQNNIARALVPLKVAGLDSVYSREMETRRIHSRLLNLAGFVLDGDLLGSQVTTVEGMSLTDFVYTRDW